MQLPHDWIVPDWPAPPGVRSVITSRNGGVSRGAYASMNLGDHVGDDPSAVTRNRALLRQHLPSEPRWLRQVHGNAVADLDAGSGTPDADAALARTRGTVCAVLVADCLPVLWCDERASVVAVAHAGWRGLANGVIEAIVRKLGVPTQSLMAYLGPAIGPDSFEVGDEVRQAFLAHDRKAAFAFLPRDNGKWLANLYLLARQRLAETGVRRVHGGGECTFSEPQRFFSYRRDKSTGRTAALVWLD
ncbi:MAG: peptidoglycan editing factor PgeF [Betaproteobacteria bacterium]|nr:peptidoglycan editing factor PgeF [Betaproteobacteria bacterium]